MSSTSSRELAASLSGSNEPECEPSHSVKSTPIAEPSSPSTGQTSPATTTCEVLPLNASPQMELLPMSSVAASPVRTSPLPERAQALKANALAYGQSTPELLANYDQDSSSWRTSQRCLVEGWTVFSGTWPRSGTMRSGTAFQLPPLVPLTGEIASGLWRTPDASIVSGGAANAEDRKRQGHAIGLHDQVNTPSMWPTPHGFSQDGKSNGPSGNELGRAVNRSMWPTPTRRDHKSDSCGPEYRAQRDAMTMGKTLPWVVGGSLNPTWVEWLMGFPLEWTALKDWGTRSSRKSRKSSGEQS